MIEKSPGKPREMKHYKKVALRISIEEKVSRPEGVVNDLANKIGALKAESPRKRRSTGERCSVSQNVSKRR